MQSPMAYPPQQQPMGYPQQQQQPMYDANGQPVYMQPMGQPMGQPMYVQQGSPVMMAPATHVVHSQPAPIQQTVIVETDNGEADLMPAILIFVLGWVCLCCIWLGGIAYLKSKNPTARLLGIASLVMYGIGSVVIIIVIIVIADIIGMDTIQSAYLG